MRKILFSLFILIVGFVFLSKTSSALAMCTLNGQQVPTGQQFCKGASYTGQVCTSSTEFGTCQSNGSWSYNACASGTACAYYPDQTNVSCLASCLGPQPPVCGNNTCESSGGESCSNCPVDCGSCPPPAPYCGDYTCNNGETCTSCPGDCGPCATTPPPSSSTTTTKPTGTTTTTTKPPTSCTPGATRCYNGTTGYCDMSHLYYQTCNTAGAWQNSTNCPAGYYPYAFGGNGQAGCVKPCGGHGTETCQQNSCTYGIAPAGTNGYACANGANCCNAAPATTTTTTTTKPTSSTTTTTKPAVTTTTTTTKPTVTTTTTVSACKAGTGSTNASCGGGNGIVQCNGNICQEKGYYCYGGATGTCTLTWTMPPGIGHSQSECCNGYPFRACVGGQCVDVSPMPTSSTTTKPTVTTTTKPPATCTLNGNPVAIGTQFCNGSSYTAGKTCTKSQSFGTCQSDGTWLYKTCANNYYCSYTSATTVVCPSSCGVAAGTTTTTIAGSTCKAGTGSTNASCGGGNGNAQCNGSICQEKGYYCAGGASGTCTLTWTMPPGIKHNNMADCCPLANTTCTNSQCLPGTPPTTTTTTKPAVTTTTTKASQCSDALSVKPSQCPDGVPTAATSKTLTWGYHYCTVGVVHETCGGEWQWAIDHKWSCRGVPGCTENPAICTKDLNFGDYNCTFSKNALYARLKALDPANASFWYNTVIPCESGYKPNAWTTAGGTTPNPAGAWGLFQMDPFATYTGSARGYKSGNVEWNTQVSNAVHTQRTNGWGYWACAK